MTDLTVLRFFVNSSFSVYCLMDHKFFSEKGRRDRDRMVVEFTTTNAISATDVVSSNLDQGEVYNITW